MEIEAAYMAGVADSDGSFTISKRKTANTTTGYHYSAMFQLSWTQSIESLATMEAIKAKYGGSFIKTKKRNDTYKKTTELYKYSAWSTSLICLIEDILPYLKLKKDQAILVLKLRDARKEWHDKHKGKANVKPKELWALEESLYEEIFRLKGQKKRDFNKETRTI